MREDDLRGARREFPVHYLCRRDLFCSLLRVTGSMNTLLNSLTYYSVKKIHYLSKRNTFTTVRNNTE